MTPFGDRGPVELTLPAVGYNLTLVRGVATAIASRLHLAVDVIDDLRLAVNEACSMLVAAGDETSILRCSFAASRTTLRIAVCVTPAVGPLPAKGSYGWMVLAGLVDRVDAAPEPAGGLGIRMELRVPVRAGQPAQC